MEFDNADYINYRISRAKETINEAKDAIGNNHLHLASNRIYYSLFYIISALALKNNFSTSKHKQLIGWFNKNYVNKDLIPKNFSKIVLKAFKNRQDCDYGDMVKLDKEEVENLYNEMLVVVSEIEKLINYI